MAIDKRPITQHTHTVLLSNVVDQFCGEKRWKKDKRRHKQVDKLIAILK